MNRPTIIATVVAATGVLVAGSVAGLAVVNAVSSTPADSSAVEVVAAQPPAQEPAVAMPTADATAPSLPDIAAPAQPKAQPSNTADTVVEPVVIAAVPKEIPSAAARKAVVKATPGSVVSITKKSRQGLKAWAVQVQRQDGSIVTGYVDRESGVVFDWTLDKKAPVATNTDDNAGNYSEQDDANENHDDEGEDDDD